MAHQAYVMRRGQIVYRGDPQALLADDLFAHYIGSQRREEVDGAAPQSFSHIPE
jgi:hypothetical protein